MQGSPSHQTRGERDMNDEIERTLGGLTDGN
jgi:hypothetical protein